jgi:Flp pilus assembly protein TadG
MSRHPIRNSAIGTTPRTARDAVVDRWAMRVVLRERRARALTADAEAGDRGSLALTMAILASAMFVFAGLVVDGGSALAARGTAASLAQEASRAGAAAVAPASLRGDSPADIVIDAAGAGRAAERVLATGGARGEVTVSTDTVTVTAHVTRRSVVLSAFGVPALTGTATATATLVHGVDTGRRIGALP